ncbi:Dirigent protein 19 [Linum grandiflorum]
MAHKPSLLILAIITINIITISPSPTSTTTNNINNSPMKQTHIKLYWQNNANTTSPNATAVISIPPPLADSPVGFGSLSIMDDPLTAGPSPDSPLLGRAQGFYAVASQQTFGLLMAMNLVFTNGSSLAVVGRNEVPLKVRELPVVGGTGVFRMAKGYVVMNTHFFDPKAGLAVVEYNIYVWHY